MDTIMIEILVYVNDVLTCSEMCDDANHSLESFRKNVVDKQVDDILVYPYKFMRLVNDQRIVGGVKEEGVISASKCIDHNRGIYLVREETKSEKIFTAPEQSASSQDTATEHAAIPDSTSKTPTKQRTVSRQPSILEFAGWRHELPKSQPYSAARARKVKIYSQKEIEGSTGLTQVYRKFWNGKAEEICANQSLTSLKAGEIQVAINVAWILQKTSHLRREVEEITAEVGQPCSNAVAKKLQMSAKTIAKKTRRVEKAHESLDNTQQELTDARFELFQAPNSCQRKKINEKVDNLENVLGVNLTELRKAEDALRKSIENKRKIVSDLEAEAGELEQEGERELPSDDSLEGSK